MFINIDKKKRLFLIIGEPCPTTYLATCLLSELDSSLVVVNGKCIEQIGRMLDMASVVGVVFVNLHPSQWEEHGAARRFMLGGPVRHCAIIDLNQSVAVPDTAPKPGWLVFRSRLTLASDLEEFFLANPKDIPCLNMADELPGSQMTVNLTRRQADVLSLLNRGYSSKRIAAQLGLNKGTVDNHVSGLLRVIGANNRAHALARAAELGILAAAPETAPLL